jgi:RNA polymerase sigma-70 factor (ECF subfamily)
MQDNSQAMDGFLASVERRAFRMAQIATKNSEDALDIVQESMLRMVSRYGNKPEAEWKPLFYRILISRIRDWYRRQKVRNRWRTWLPLIRKKGESLDADPIEALPDPVSQNPSQQIIINQSLAAVDKALQTLPPRQQQAFLLRAWEGLSVREAAAVMKCSKGSVKTHYARALLKLRDLLEEYRP